MREESESHEREEEEEEEADDDDDDDDDDDERKSTLSVREKWLRANSHLIRVNQTFFSSNAFETERINTREFG